MNELIENAVAEVARRAAELETRNGRLLAEQKMAEVFGVLTAYGYKLPQGDARLMMTAWADALKEYIAMYGYDRLHDGVRHFAKTDKRPYKDFPRPSDIIEAIKAVGGIDPRLQKARSDARAREERLIAQWREERRPEVEKWAQEHAEQIEEWIRRNRR